MKEISEFRGEYRFLSNFYICPVKHGARTWRSAEHAYQASKTMIPAEKNRIAEHFSAGAAKKAGCQITLRKDWEEKKIRIMDEIVRAKFSQNSVLRDLLLRTGDRNLIEGNQWGDTVWGVDSRTGKGENYLGKILMKIRAELR